MEPSFQKLEKRLMLCGIKYCGGCNPRYDRGEAFRKIKGHFEGREGRIDFQLAQEGVEYDVLLVISGCHNNCATVDMYKWKRAIVSVTKESHTDRAIRKLEKYLKE